jgi:hypothetical protein
MELVKIFEKSEEVHTVKKFVLLAIVAGLSMTAAVPATAADLTATGFIGISGTVFKNIPPAVSNFYMPAAPDNQLNKMGAYMAMRGRLGFNVRASEDLVGVFMFEMDSNRFGEWGGAAATGTAGNGNGGRNQMGTFGADRNSIEIKNVYIDFRIPPKLPVWARVGLMNYAIRPSVFLSFDAAGASLRTVINPIKLSITGYYAKILDATPGQGGAPPADRAFWEAVTGSELYAIDANIPLTLSPQFSIKPGAFFVYQTVRMDGSTAGIGSGGPGTATASSVNIFGAGVDSSYLYWLGAYLNGKIGPFPMELDFIYQGGKVHYTEAFNQHTTLGSFLFRGSVSYVFKGLEVGGGGMYVQGENYDRYYNTNAGGAPVQYAPNMGARSSRFLLPQPAMDGVLGDSIVYFGGWMGTNLNQHNGSLWSNRSEYPGFWYARGYAYYKVFDWLKLGAQLMYLAGTDRYEDNRPFVEFWNARHDGGHNGIGWEMDYGVNCQIYKNLAFNGAFGYLFAQKYLSMVGGVAPSDPWNFVGLLIYTF